MSALKHKSSALCRVWLANIISDKNFLLFSVIFIVIITSYIKDIYINEVKRKNGNRNERRLIIIVVESVRACSTMLEWELTKDEENKFNNAVEQIFE